MDVNIYTGGDKMGKIQKPERLQARTDSNSRGSTGTNNCNGGLLWVPNPDIWEYTCFGYVDQIRINTSGHANHRYIRWCNKNTRTKLGMSFVIKLQV